MGSQGGGSTKTTQTSDPWGPQQAYLKQVFGQAQNLYNQGQGTAGQVAPLYQTYLNEALTQGLGQLPGESAVNQAWGQALNAPAAMNPQIQAVIQSGYAPHMGQVIANQIRAGYTPNSAIPALQQVANESWADPYTNAVMGATGTKNPYIDRTAALSELALANPAIAGLVNTASGNYLTPETNPYLQESVQNALDQANATIASQFNQGGRYGSGMMAGTQARELGKIATGAYANAYESERARQEAANQALGQQFLSGVGQAASGNQAAGGLAQNQLGQNIQAMLGAGGLAGQQQQLQQQGISDVAQLTGADINRQLQAQQSGVQAYLQEVQNQMAAQQAGINAQIQAHGIANNALQFAPVMQSMNQQQLADLANAAQVQQQLMQLPQQQQWENLANYLAMIQGNYGGTSVSKAPGAGGSNLGGQILGGLTAGAGIASMFSARAFKNERSRANPAAVADGVLGLPITTWSYRGQDEIHIGPYAEDFRDAFGVGDGITIKYADMFGVLFATVQHLLAKNAEQAATIADLTDRIEEIEDAI